LRILIIGNKSENGRLPAEFLWIAMMQRVIYKNRSGFFRSGFLMLYLAFFTSIHSAS